jgi:uncharacterized RDD family membrane protein YckC
MPEDIKKAGLLVRTIAKILDFIIIAAALEIIPKAGFFAGLAYLLIGDGLFDGRSLGKKLIGIKVVSADMLTPCSFRESILRNSTFGIGFILYKAMWFGWIFIFVAVIIEFLILLGSREQKRLGDEIAKTFVIDTPQYKQEA